MGEFPTLLESELFEQRIHQIHELLEGADAEVVWNDNVPDPDNPTRQRQVDVTIKRGGHLTIVECRLRKQPQDVKWIEELIGRRASLGAHSVIAVSARGFTKGARLKAERHGIALRDLRVLTDAHVISWGQSVSLTIVCYQYSNLTLSVWVDDPAAFRRDLLAEQLPSHPALLALLNQTRRYLTEHEMVTDERLNIETDFRFTIALPSSPQLAGSSATGLGLRGKVRPIELPISAPRVESYVAVDSGGRDDAIIERFALGQTSIVHDRDRISFRLDISALELPAMCQFAAPKARAQHEVDWDQFGLVGWQNLVRIVGPLVLTVEVHAGAPPLE